MANQRTDTAHLRDHHIICGVGHVGFRIAELLVQIQEPLVVIANSIRPEWEDLLKQRHIPFILGDARHESVLKQAGIATARTIHIVTSHDLANLHIAADAERLHPGIQRLVRVFDHDIAERVERQMGIRHVYSPALLTTPAFIAAAQGAEMLLSVPVHNGTVEIVKLAVHAPHVTPDTTHIDEFCATHNLVPLALQPLPDQRSRAEQKGSDTIPAFHLIAACTHETSDALRAMRLLPALEASNQRTRKQSRAEEPNQFRPIAESGISNESRRHNTGKQPLTLREVRRAWRGLSPFLRLAFLCLLAILSTSVLVFRFALNITWIDSLYFVISILTTVGFGDYNLHDSPPWVKLYGCFVMLAGASLVAIVYGIITDFIVSARVDHALGGRKRFTTLTGHIVIVGLGDVGTRVAQVLKSLGKPVVAIERSRDHEAAPAITEDLPMVFGDANRRTVLEQANIRGAQAIIVTTEDDLENLRIAHQAERANPNLHTIVRIYDSMLATRLVSDLGIDRAVNSAASAAATFVAATVHPETIYGFTHNDQLFVLRWMEPKEIMERHLVYKTIQEIRQNGIPALMIGANLPTPLSKNRRMVCASPRDTIRPEHSLLVIESYDPETRKLVSPNI